MLEIRDINIGFENNLLYRINALQVSQGLHILVGANGSGKTTLLQSLLTAKKTGFFLDGENLGGMPSDMKAKKVAYISSSFNGLAYLRLQEYLELGRFPHTGKSGRIGEKDGEVIQHYSTRFDLNHLLQQFTSTLSDGERQRSSIARGFIQETPLVLLDEPTSFLDYPFKRSILQQLRTAADDEKKIIIASSHDLEIACQYATSFLVIDPMRKELIQLPSGVDFGDLLQTAFPELSRP